MPAATKPQRAGQTQAADADSNGQETAPTNEELAINQAALQEQMENMVSTVGTLAETVDQRVGEMGTIVGNIQTTLAEEPRIVERAARRGAHEAIEEDIKGVKNQAKYKARRVLHVMIPGSEGDLKKDLVHMGQGLVFGFVGGRRMGPLPFTGW